MKIYNKFNQWIFISNSYHNIIKYLEGGYKMRKRIGILVCTLVIFAIVLPVPMALNINNTNEEIPTSPSPHLRTVVTLYPIMDSFVSDYTPGTNYGLDPDLRVGDCHIIYRSYLQFDVTIIPSGANIISAKLGLYFDDRECVDDKEIGVYSVNSAWNELTVTYSLQPTFAAAPEDVQTLPWDPTFTYFYWDLTSLVKSWVDGSFTNNGVVAKGVTETGSNADKYFPSSDAGANIPTLTIEYTNSRDRAVRNLFLNLLEQFPILKLFLKF
jgi:hypothetical protein